MLPRNMKLTWATVEGINFNQVRDEAGRVFIRELRSVPRSITTDVYLCSDARNQAVAQILSHIPYINVLNTAGNVVYKPRERPSVIIAHGDSEFVGCGAIDYSRNRVEAGGPPDFPALAKLKAHAIMNAEEQLEKILPEWRAGVIYFDHNKAEVSMIDGEYEKKTTGLMLFDELDRCLWNRYTKKELERMAAGQNPEIIFLNNISTRFSAFRTFRINLQRDGYDGIINDSLKYAMENALRGKGSFKDTKITVMAFRRDEPIPFQIQDLLENEIYVREYLKRGGEVYIVTVGDLPSSNEIYRIKMTTK